MTWQQRSIEGENCHNLRIPHAFIGRKGEGEGETALGGDLK